MDSVIGLEEFVRLSPQNIALIEDAYNKSYFLKFVSNYYNNLLGNRAEMSGHFQLYDHRFNIPTNMLNKFNREVMNALFASGKAVKELLKTGILIISFEKQDNLTFLKGDIIETMTKIHKFLNENNTEDILNQPETFTESKDKPALKTPKNKQKIINEIVKDTDHLFSIISYPNKNKADHRLTVIPLNDVDFFYKKNILTQEYEFRVFEKRPRNFRDMRTMAERELKNIMVFVGASILDETGKVNSPFMDVIPILSDGELIEKSYIQATESKASPDRVDELPEQKDARQTITAYQDMLETGDKTSVQAIRIAKAQGVLQERTQFEERIKEEMKTRQDTEREKNFYKYANSGPYTQLMYNNGFKVFNKPINSTMGIPLLPGHKVVSLNDSLNDGHNLDFTRYFLEKASSALGLSLKFITGDFSSKNSEIADAHYESVMVFSKPYREVLTAAVNRLFLIMCMEELEYYVAILENTILRKSNVEIDDGMAAVLRSNFLVNIEFVQMGDKRRLTPETLEWLYKIGSIPMDTYKELGLMSVNLDPSLKNKEDTEQDIKMEKKRLKRLAEFDIIRGNIENNEKGPVVSSGNKSKKEKKESDGKKEKNDKKEKTEKKEPKKE